ncbi:MAG: hypothetical protein V7L25_22750 [Nostoc sp.]|uniref:hypothetical protein n=1 Tax=Nostoc sp. TaxID=1180 RepID=UPI002FEF1D7E
MLDIIHSLIACLASVILWNQVEVDYQQAWYDQSADAVILRITATVYTQVSRVAPQAFDPSNPRRLFQPLTV